MRFNQRFHRRLGNLSFVLGFASIIASIAIWFT
jgi:hypothetical protein